MNDNNTIRLDQFLKLQSAVSTGGEAKLRIQSGEVLVNGEVETRRRRQLVLGDVVVFNDLEYVVESDGEDEETENEPVTE